MTTHGDGHEGLVVVGGDNDSAVRTVDLFAEEPTAQRAGAIANARAEQWTAVNVATTVRNWLFTQSSWLSGPRE